MSGIQTISVNLDLITDPINLTEPPAGYIAQNTGDGKWRAGSLFRKLKRGSSGRKGGAHSGPCGYKTRRDTFFRGKGVIVKGHH